MRGLFWVLMLFGLAVAVALAARFNDGYVLFVLAPWRVEMSLNALFVALFVAFIVIYLTLRALFATLAMPGRVQAYRRQRQRDKAEVVFLDAVRLLFEGRFGQALKRAGDAHAAGRAPGLAALIAARAAQRLGDAERQQLWLARARQDDPHNEAATLMLEAEMLNEARQFDRALVVLGQLQGKLGRHIAALRLELRARQGLGDWDGALKLLRQLAKRDALPALTVATLCNQAHHGKLAQLATDRVALLTYLRTLPAVERTPDVVLAASQSLLAVAADEEAQRLIESCLATADEAVWQGELVGIYGRLTGGDLLSRIAQAEKWLQQRAQDAGLLLALGRMCGRQRLWGKAQSYLEASLAISATQAVHLELARLHDQLERPDEANRHYRAAVQTSLSH